MTQANFADNTPDAGHGQDYGQLQASFVSEIQAARQAAESKQQARKGPTAGVESAARRAPGQEG